MKKNKTIISLLALLFFGIVGAANLEFQPLYSDPRFQPADKLHAGCDNYIDVMLKDSDQVFDKLHIEIFYLPDDLDIIKLVPANTYKINFDYKIQDNKIIVDMQEIGKITGQTKLFQLQFDTKNNLTGSWLELGQNSFLITSKDEKQQLVERLDIQFAQVPECEPDIMMPTVALLYPKTQEQLVSLDSYFSFQVEDTGKGIDKDSAVLKINDQQYSIVSGDLVRNGNILSWYPDGWLPLDTELHIQLSVADNQVYGGPNKIEQTYIFQIVDDLIFDNNLLPSDFRETGKKVIKIEGTVSECDFLGEIYQRATGKYQFYAQSVIKKLSCTIPDKTQIHETKEIKESLKSTSPNKIRNVSVFAALGWILFIITLLLKLHYLHGYHKNKRTVKKIKKELRK